MLRAAFNQPPACDNLRKSIESQILARNRLRDADFKALADVGAFCQQLRASVTEDTIECHKSCESDLASDFRYAKEEQERSARKQAAQAKAEQDIQDRKKAEDEAAAIRSAQLKAGKARPETLEEAMIVHDAKSGADLASAPKIRPDGKLYALNGKIRIAEDAPEFLATAGLSENEELNVNLHRLRAGNMVPYEGSTRYFKVIVPKAMRDYYFGQAKIDGGFDVVGRYVANTKYKTLAGQEKSAPVFEAVYLRLW